MVKHEHRSLLVALAGQPNVGKSAVFNMLTGSRQHVANFPGVTVEKRQGIVEAGGYRCEVVDLPGTYSIASYSPEERVARDFLLLEQPEVVVVVLDASNLERSLYLYVQLHEMGLPMVVCLNRMDIARRRGISIDPKKLGQLLGSEVIETVATRYEGREALLEAITRAADGDKDKQEKIKRWRVDYGEWIEPVLAKMEEVFSGREHLMEDFRARWLAVRFMEHDPDAYRVVQHHTHDGSGPDLCRDLRNLCKDAEDEHQIDARSVIADARHLKATELAEAVSRHRLAFSRTKSDRIDELVLHPFWAPLILVGVLALFYQLTIAFGDGLANALFPYLEKVRIPIAMLFESPSLLRDGLTQSLVMDGVVHGVLSILFYLPVFFVLFMLLAALEDSGYMARIAFLMDRTLRRFGLSGQSILPMLVGGMVVGGCVVPGVMATRSIRDRRARLITILIMPLMNCMAKLPFYVLAVSLIIPAAAGFSVFGLFSLKYRALGLLGVSVFSLLVALCLAKLFSRFLVKGDDEPFVMELPPYQVPMIRAMLRSTFTRLWDFLKKVLTLVTGVMVVIWALSIFPGLPDEREAQYDSRFDSAVNAVQTSIGRETPYAHVADTESLRHFVAFSEKYHEKLDNADTEAEKEARHAHFLAQNRDFALLASMGRQDDGTIDAEAASAGEALLKFSETVGDLRSEREREVFTTSFAGRIGRSAESVTQFAGFEWRFNVAMMGAFAAKESFVSTLTALYGVETDEEDAGLSEAIHAAEPDWTLPHYLSMLVFLALFPPCFPTLLVIKSETGRARWAWFAAIYPVVLGFALAVIVFQVGMAILV
jgi:ferrous iron transport protein B